MVEIIIEQIENQVRSVAEARIRAQEALDAKNSAYIEWENQNRGLLDAVVSTTQQVSEVEGRLRELTLQAFAETGNKAPTIGVGIREVTKLEYDTKVAFNWAIEHKMALKLDVSSFEKIAKLSPPDFVNVSQQPQATIATNLELAKLYPVEGDK